MNNTRNVNEERKRRRKLTTCTTIVGCVVVLVVGGLLLCSCDATQAQTYTIGVVNVFPLHEQILAGFKAGMTDLGYVEDDNVTYIYNGVMSDSQAIASEIENLQAQDVDLILMLGNLPQEIVEKIDTPTVFAPVVNPVESGMVDSISQPGGYLTGVQVSVGGPLLKSLEWLLTIAPETTKVYVPFDPSYMQMGSDVVDINVSALIQGVAALGAELVPGMVRSSEEVVTAITGLPKDTGILLIPMASLEPGMGDIIEAANQRGIAVGSTLPYHLELGVLFVYGIDYFHIGEKQLARLADQILQGTDPSNLPVEKTEFFLSINMKTAEAIGLDIPDTVLEQAINVVR